MIEPNEASREVSRSSRRSFLKRSAVSAGAVLTASLNSFMVRRAEGSPLAPIPYGSISPKNDEATGLPLIQLPDGFRYITYSWTGDLLSDGVKCPALHDGMAVIDELNSSNDRDQWGAKGDGDRPRRHKGKDEEDESEAGLIVLCRNHEVDVPGTPYFSRPAITYRDDGPGGNTNLIFDPQNGRWLAAYSTLARTRPSLRRRGHTVEYLDLLRRDGRGRTRMELRGRDLQRKPEADLRHGPILP
jgi:uncharacterized protein